MACYLKRICYAFSGMSPTAILAWTWKARKETDKMMKIKRKKEEAKPPAAGPSAQTPRAPDHLVGVVGRSGTPNRCQTSPATVWPCSVRLPDDRHLGTRRSGALGAGRVQAWRPTIRRKLARRSGAWRSSSCARHQRQTVRHGKCRMIQRPCGLRADPVALFPTDFPLFRT